MEMIEIDATLARSWIANTTNQRTVSKSTVAKYASDMASGRWRPDVCPPILLNDEDDSIIDGQHRLHASLEVDGYRLRSYVRRVAGDAITVVDTGKPRSLMDTLSVNGFANAKELSATFNTSYYWITGSTPGKDLTRTRQIELLNANPNHQKAGAFAHEVGIRSGAMRVPFGVLGTLYDISQYAEGEGPLREWVGEIHSGLVTTDMHRRLVEWVTEVKNPRTRSNVSIRHLQLMYARVYAAWLNDEQLSKLFARRRAVLAALPGYGGWLQGSYPSLAEKSIL